MRYHFSTSRAEIKTFQASLIHILLHDNHWCVQRIIKMVGHFQGKGAPCYITQKRMGITYGVSQFCINRTVKLLRDLGILLVKKIWVAGYRWQFNEMYLAPIMFTKGMVESLSGIIEYFHFNNYFSLSKSNLIESNINKSKSFVISKKQNPEEKLQTVLKAAEWDKLVCW